jgi:hypothetical protein
VVQGSAEWLEARKGFFTASDAAAFLVADRERARLEVLRQAERERPVSASLQALFDWGHEHEEDAARAFVDFLCALGLPAAAHRTGLHVHENHWLAASLDRVVVFQGPGGKVCAPVELKCTHRTPDGPHPRHIRQVQVQLEVVHSQAEAFERKYEARLLPWAYLVYWSPSPRISPFTIERAPGFPYDLLKGYWEEIQKARNHLHGGKTRKEKPETNPAEAEGAGAGAVSR